MYHEDKWDTKGSIYMTNQFQHKSGFWGPVQTKFLKVNRPSKMVTEQKETKYYEFEVNKTKKEEFGVQTIPLRDKGVKIRDLR